MPMTSIYTVVSSCEVSMSTPKSMRTSPSMAFMAVCEKLPAAQPSVMTVNMMTAKAVTRCAFTGLGLFDCGAPPVCALIVR